MQLTGEKNIHFRKEVACTPPADFTPRFRKVTRSPWEEMGARVLGHGTMEPIPDSLAALMLQSQREETVAPNGIAFIVDGKTYRYFHPDSQICALRVGEKVLFSYDRDNMEVIYCLSAEGRFQEAIPLDGEVEWFGEDVQKKTDGYRRAAKRVHDGLKKTHAKTSKKEHDRTKANAQAIQATHHFPLPKQEQKEDLSFERKSYTPNDNSRLPLSDRGGQTARGFRIADEVKKAQEDIARQKNSFEERTGKRNRKAAELDEMADASISELYDA